MPPVDSSSTPSAASPRANSTRPVLSETDSSACVSADMRLMRAAMRDSGRQRCVLGELGAQRVAVHAEHVGRLRLVAARRASITDAISARSTWSITMS